MKIDWRTYGADGALAGVTTASLLHCLDKNELNLKGKCLQEINNILYPSDATSSNIIE